MNYHSRYPCRAVPCILHIICKLLIIFLGKVEAGQEWSTIYNPRDANRANFKPKPRSKP